MTLLYLDHTGPMLVYKNGVLTISDLNPEMEVNWRMSRLEMFRIAWRFLLAAIAFSKEADVGA